MYEILINDELVGLGLSKGETNQWLLDLFNELSLEQKDNFKLSLGFQGEDKLIEDYLYETDFKIPMKINFGNEIITIIDCDM